MPMTAEQAQQVKQLFDAAFEIAPAARAEFLAATCNDDHEVRAEIEKLLRLSAEAGDFLEDQSFSNELFASSSATDAAATAIGRRIGAYEVIRELGRGGMGAVFLAHRADEAFDKQVAIKLVWPTFGGDELLRRFHQERQILARLEHPNIARLLDAGATEEGWPYLVMEYVDGVPITTYCKQRQLSIAERLQLFRTVCAAVQYAHQNLIVHRDLKPGNILVTADGTPKLLDFGIAKLLAPDAASHAPSTRTGLRPMTPEYASPEQMREEAITTASDVYSLGVLLYELLTGAHPHELKDRSLHEITRIVCEEDPPPPSVRATQLRGDLDNIVLLALHKDARARYQTVEQFSEDINRYLAGKTITARPATLHYRTGKFIKRHQAQLAVVSVLMLALFGFLAREVQLRWRAEDQNRQQRRQLYAAQMQQALRNWEESNVPLMRETLAHWQPRAGEEDLRGFEWRYLWSLLNAELFTIRPDESIHTSIHTMALSPSGELMVVGTNKGLVILLNAHNGQRVALLGGHHEYIRSLAFSTDGKQLASADAAGLVRLWDVAQQREIRQFRGHGNQVVYAVAFSPDGRSLATASRDTTVKLWSVATGQELHTLRGHNAGGRAVVFSPDGQTLFTSSDEPGVRGWDVTTGRPIARLPGLKVGAFSLTVTPDGKQMAAAGLAKEFVMWELATGKIVRVFAGHTDTVASISLSPDGKMLASASVDRTVRLWETATGRAVAVIKGHQHDTSFLAFTPDGRRLITGDHQELKFWNLDDVLRPEALRVSNRCGISVISLSAAGGLLATGEWLDGGAACQPPLELAVWEVASGKQSWRLPSARAITGLAFMPNPERLAYAAMDGSAAIVDMAVGQQQVQFTGHQTPVTSHGDSRQYTGAIFALDVAPDGRLLATGSEKNMVKLWTPEGREVRSLRGPGQATDSGGHHVYAVAFSHDSRRLAIGGYDHGVDVFDPASDQKVLWLAGHERAVLNIKFSPDDRMIATAGEDNLVKIWGAVDGQLLKTFKGHGHYVNALAWTPDGQRLVSAGKDKTIRIWNVALEMEVLTLHGHTDAITALAFARDGRLLVSAGGDGVARLWRAATEAEVRAHYRR